MNEHDVDATEVTATPRRSVRAKRPTSPAIGEVIATEEIKRAGEPLPESIEYIKRLCANTGTDFKSIKKPKLDDMSTIVSKNDINKAFFTYIETIGKPEEVKMDEALMAKLEGLIDIKNTNIYQSIINNIDAQIRGANDSARRVSECLASAAVEREKLMLYEGGKNPHSLLKEVKAITEGGWYVFELDKSKLDAGGDNRTIKLVFSTGNVIINHEVPNPTNPSEKTKMTVDFGRFLVTYFPYTNNISVSKYKDNITAANHLHPHVSSSNQVCWGNVATAYSQAMQQYNPSLVFPALRSLLETYNAESPYVALSQFAGFAQARDTGNPHIRFNQDYALRLTSQPADLPETEIVTKDMTKQLIWLKIYTKVTHYGAEFFYKATDGSYKNASPLGLCDQRRNGL